MSEFDFSGWSDAELHASVESSFDDHGADLSNDEMLKRLLALRTENAALKEAQRWVPVSERLPKEHVTVMVFGRYGSGEKWKEALLGYRHHVPGYGWMWSWGNESLDVTHWQPLPAPPKGGV